MSIEFDNQLRSLSDALSKLHVSMNVLTEVAIQAEGLGQNEQVPFLFLGSETAHLFKFIGRFTGNALSSVNFS